MVSIYIPNLEEFLPVVERARSIAGCRVSGPIKGYWLVSAEQEIRFERKALGLRVALWNSALTGGFIGRIAEYDRDTLRIVEE
jgi:hypothetical protein